jgi:N-acetyl-1-D-myo-inositol-2-amino-2-deoxy-alpha-D-glucopyranoside deacetylase
MTERVLFVHAHPDDESISTGGTLAALVARGAQVTVLTCTRGEEGELVDPSLAGRDLARVREGEIASALRILGVTDHRWLGAADARVPHTGTRVYRDSGMRWGPDGAQAIDDPAEGSLLAAEFGDVASDIATVIADTAADAVVSYDVGGGYGHPDHVLAGRAARWAADVMRVPYYGIVTDRGPADVELDVRPTLELKRAALAEYRSQLVVERDRFAGANGEWEPIADTERYRRENPRADRTESSFTSLGGGGRAFVLVVALALGAFAGLVLTAFVVALVAWWAAAIAVAAVAALVVGLRLAFRSRLVAAVAALGLVLASGGILVRAELGEVLPSDLLAAVGTVVVVAAALAWPGVGARRAGRIVEHSKPKGPAPS